MKKKVVKGQKNCFGSNRRNPDGSFSYDRHKIFLYKEDFAKFSEGLSEAVDFIRRSKPEFFERKPEPAEG